MLPALVLAKLDFVRREILGCRVQRRLKIVIHVDGEVDGWTSSCVKDRENVRQPLCQVRVIARLLSYSPTCNMARRIWAYQLRHVPYLALGPAAFRRRLARENVQRQRAEFAIYQNFGVYLEYWNQVRGIQQLAKTAAHQQTVGLAGFSISNGEALMIILLLGSPACTSANAAPTDVSHAEAFSLFALERLPVSPAGLPCSAYCEFPTSPAWKV